ncbi:MAG: serine hydrolase domain-containing protein [Actinomycetota bacterium]
MTAGLSRRSLLKGAIGAGILTALPVPVSALVKPVARPPFQGGLHGFIRGTCARPCFPVCRPPPRVVWAHGYGWADIASERRVGTDTTFMLASVSKTVTGVAALQGMEQGLYGLDDDISEILSFPVRNPHFPDEAITPRMLLTHTSSLRDNWGVLNASYVHGDSPISLADYMEGYFVKGGENYNRDKNFRPTKPGASYAYCNEAVALAGLLVEQSAGMPFDRWCKEQLFEPLGMKDTSWHLEGLDRERVATPYRYIRPGDRFEAIAQYGYPDYPDGQLRTSPSQLAKFLAAVSNGGAGENGARILEERTVDEMLSNQLGDLVVWKQGLIWWGVGNQTTGPIMGHNGGDKGVATYMFFSPKTRAGVALVSNGSWRSAAAGHAYRRIRDRLLIQPFGD